MQSLQFFCAGSLAAVVSTAPTSNGQDHGVGGKSGNGWNLKNFKSFVAFGDSYTDESRLTYFFAHGGSAPPVG